MDFFVCTGCKAKIPPGGNCQSIGASVLLCGECLSLAEGILLGTDWDKGDYWWKALRIAAEKAPSVRPWHMGLGTDSETVYGFFDESMLVLPSAENQAFDEPWAACKAWPISSIPLCDQDPYKNMGIKRARTKSQLQAYVRAIENSARLQRSST